MEPVIFQTHWESQAAGLSSIREGLTDEVYQRSRLPAHRTMVDAYWDVEYDHMTFFNRHRYSGHDSFKTVLSKARRKGISP